MKEIKWLVWSMRSDAAWKVLVSSVHIHSTPLNEVYSMALKVHLNHVRSEIVDVVRKQVDEIGKQEV